MPFPSNFSSISLLNQASRNMALAAKKGGGQDTRSKKPNINESTILAIIIGAFIIILSAFLYSINSTKKYSGTIIEKATDEIKYKHSSETKYFIIMRVDSTNQTIRVNVTTALWYTLSKGQKVSFNLSKRDLEDYGN